MVFNTSSKRLRPGVELNTEAAFKPQEMELREDKLEAISETFKLTSGDAPHMFSTRA